MKSDADFTDSSLQKNDEIRKIRIYAVTVTVFWTLLLSGLFTAYVLDNRKSIHEISHSMTQAAFEKDILFRRWAARLGGVYVPETETTPANPLLADIPERDVITPSGRRLTLIHPAIMTRQIFDLALEQEGLIQGHIASLNPIRPENAPDAWETQALKALEQGAKEVIGRVLVDGQPHLRVMRPLVTEKPCLKCHASQGYKEGNMRGGISVTLSQTSIYKTMNGQMLHEALIHLFIWLLGIGFIWYGTQRIILATTFLRNERNSLYESEEKLRRSQRQLSDIIEFLPDATLAIDKERRVIIWNRAIEEMTGIPAAEMIGKGEYAYTIPFYGEARPQLMDLVFENREDIAARYTNITRTGSNLTAEIFCNALYKNRGAWIFVKTSPLHDDSGNIVGAIESIRDITERKRAEEAIIEREERYRALFTRAGDGILIMSSEGKLIEVNDALARMHGYTAQEMLKLELGHLDAQVTSGLAPDRMRRLFAGETLTFEVEHYHKDGHLFPLEVSASMISSGGELFIQSFHRDITERKQAEDERRQLEQQFNHAQKLESLGVLAGGVAHDFNNILTVILGHCHMAAGNTDLKQEYKTVFKKIEIAASRAADLCRQMLTYAGRTEFEITKVSLRHLVDEVVKMLQSTIKKNVTIELDLNRHVPEIMGDSGQIQQIVMNLIINAAEAIGDDNGIIRVLLTSEAIYSDQMEKDTFGNLIKAGRYACLEVADTGTGMDEETRERLFEPFYTTKFTGRGLGMSAIRGIIKSHGATLQLASEPGVGTTFKVYFHLSEVADYSVNPPTASTPSDFDEQEKKVNESVFFPKKPENNFLSNRCTVGTVLLVDDEEILRNMGEDLLETMNFSAITASNGREALEIYRRSSSEIDLILLDLIMPVMGGIEAYHELRRISPTLPIIICSGYNVESARSVVNNDQHAGFVNKPYNPDELRDAMMRMMDQNNGTSETI